MFKRYSGLFLIAIMLVTAGILANTRVVRAANPTIFIDPSAAIGDLTPTPGSKTRWKINVSDIGEPGMISDEFFMALDPEAFPEYYPTEGNSNFTANFDGWTTTVYSTTGGTPTYGWDGTDGNPTSGSGPGSLYLRATSTETQIASITFYSEYSFTWPGITPIDGAARLSFAYKISGTSIGSPNTIHIMTVKPTGTGSLVQKSYSTAQPWSYNFTLAGASAFNLAGNYKLRLRTVLKAAAVGTSNYVQVNWDDVGLMLAKVQVAKGPFLESDSRNVGKSIWSPKYFKFETNSSIYFLHSLMGTPWTDIWPVQGSGTIAYINVTAEYGSGYLKFWGEKLIEPTLVPPYTPREMDPHDVRNAYFSNTIPGDIAGPENPPASGRYPSDGNVNNYDLTYLKTKFGTSDPKADFTGPENPPGSGTYPPDGIVNVRDLRLIGKNYGRHYP